MLFAMLDGIVVLKYSLVPFSFCLIFKNFFASNYKVVVLWFTLSLIGLVHDFNGLFNEDFFKILMKKKRKIYFPNKHSWKRWPDANI